VAKTFVTCHMEIHINKLGMNTSTGSSHFMWFCFNATWKFIYAITFALTWFGADDVWYFLVKHDLP
jgi:hypothetical protein